MVSELLSTKTARSINRKLAPNVTLVPVCAPVGTRACLIACLGMVSVVGDYFLLSAPRKVLEKGKGLDLESWRLILGLKSAAR